VAQTDGASQLPGIAPWEVQAMIPEDLLVADAYDNAYRELFCTDQPVHDDESILGRGLGQLVNRWLRESLQAFQLVPVTSNRVLADTPPRA
jgi:hypothetical protein